MKKFWNLMLAALVVLGAVACTESVEDLGLAPQQGLSFEATIDLEETRTDVVFNEETNKWETVWTGNETLTVKSGYTVYDFKNSVDNKNRFVCTNDGVKSFIGQKVEIFLTLDEENNTLNSKAGKAGGKIRAVVDSFDPAAGVNLQVESAFLRYSSTSEVTLNASANIFDYNGQVRNTITLPAGEDVWVAVNTAENVTLSYSIGGTLCKEKALTIAAKKIYNLGVLELPKPEYKVYVYKYNNVWTKVNLYAWDGAGGIHTAAWPGSANTTTETINGYEYLVWTMPTTANDADLNIILNDGTTQTGDFKLGKLNQDYYVLLNGVTVSLIEDKENPEPEVVEGEPQPSTWALAGDFNSWGDLVMYTTDVDNLFVAKSVNIGAYKEVKIKQVGNWNTSYGGGITNLNANIWTKVYSGGANMAIINAGTYDIYFDKANTRIYVMKSGVDYTTAKEQTTNGAAQDTSNFSWGLCGTHNNWGTNDTPLVWDENVGMYVAKNAKLTGSFKVRADKSWSVNYGGKTITVDNASGTVLTKNASTDCKVTSGTYDVYWDYSTTKIWVKTPGSAAPAM